MRLLGWIAICLAVHFHVLSKRGLSVSPGGKEVIKVKKLIFPVLLPIFFVYATRSVFKPGYEIPSTIVVAILGVIFGLLVDYMVLSASRESKTE